MLHDVFERTFLLNHRASLTSSGSNAIYAIAIQSNSGEMANIPLSTAAAPSTTTAASRAIIARKLRFIFASGESPGTVTINSPAKAAEINPIAQPASIPVTPSSPASLRVGTMPITPNTAITPTAIPKKRGYRLLALVVIFSGFAHSSHGLLHQVVEPADDTHNHSGEKGPGGRVVLAVDPVPDER